MEHEAKARELKKTNNCSTALYLAFLEDNEIGKDFPAPRSIDGKCGALLTAEFILRELGYAEMIEEFEKEFVKRFGYATCVDLMTHERRCTDYVGECARMIDEILNKGE